MEILACKSKRKKNQNTVSPMKAHWTEKAGFNRKGVEVGGATAQNQVQIHIT